MVVPVEAEAEDLDARHRVIVLEPPDRERVCRDRDDVAGCGVPSSRELLAPDAELLPQSITVTAHRYVAAVHLHGFDVETDREAHPHLRHPCLCLVDTQGAHADVEQPDGKPARSDGPHLDIEVPSCGLGRYPSTNDRPEAQDNDQPHRDEPGAEKYLSPAQR
jgi:hypothetical protein